MNSHNAMILPKDCNVSQELINMLKGLGVIADIPRSETEYNFLFLSGKLDNIYLSCDEHRELVKHLLDLSSRLSVFNISSWNSMKVRSRSGMVKKIDGEWMVSDIENINGVIIYLDNIYRDDIDSILFLLSFTNFKYYVIENDPSSHNENSLYYRILYRISKVKKSLKVLK